MNVCDAGRHAGTQRYEKGLTFIRVGAWLARALRVQDRLPPLVPPQVCDAGRHAETRKRVDIYTVGFVIFVFRGHDAKYVHVVQKPNFNPNMIGIHNPSTAQYNKGNPSLNDINHDVRVTDTASRILYVLTVF